jgi:hypothetical protein
MPFSLLTACPEGFEVVRLLRLFLSRERQREDKDYPPLRARIRHTVVGNRDVRRHNAKSSPCCAMDLRFFSV